MKKFDPLITPGDWKVRVQENGHNIHVRKIAKASTDDIQAMTAVPELLKVLSAARVFLNYVEGYLNPIYFLGLQELIDSIDELDEKHREEV